MRYRKLGSTGIEVSEIGFGAWGIGGNNKGAVAYGAIDEAEARRSILAAVDAGVNLFDTSDFYGYGHSETTLGDTLKPHRERVLLATKCGMVDSLGNQNFNSDHIRRSLESSLRRLNTDYVDLYQLHSPPIEVVAQDERIIETLEQLKQSGKIRTYGISVRSPEDGVRAVREFGFGCLQANFNLIDQRMIDCGLAELCESRGAGIIARTPLVFGFLTGRYAATDNFSPDDHRRRWTPEQRAQWAAAPKLFEPLIAGEPQTPSQFALRFCLSFPAVSAAIPGMLIREHVMENTAASALGPLPAAALDEVIAIYRRNTFFPRQ
jgi:aryl-alcohol dehydrogenase-like predicted oxidoreductase